MNSTFFIIHIPAHSNLPGLLASANAPDDALAASLPLVLSLKATQKSQELLHQNEKRYKYNSLYPMNKHNTSFMPGLFLLSPHCPLLA